MIVVMMRIVMMMMNVVNWSWFIVVMIYKAGLDNDVDEGEVMMRMTIMVRVMMQRTKLRHTRRDEIIKALLGNPTQRPAQRGFSA